jgi:hypothetical protein
MSHTGCTCSGPGFCPRHQVEKSARLFELCQTRPHYFLAWEQGRGPGQRGTSAVQPSAAPSDFPPLHRQAWNLARSLASFVADGCTTVAKEQYQCRLAICDTCDQRRGNRCLVCGCRLSLKALGRAFECPLGKWPTA